MKPRVTIIWLNYNGQRIIEISKASILSIRNLSYSNFEVIVLDNGSRDGSFDGIKKYVGEIGLNAKMVSIKQNLGFSGGNNFAYKFRDPSSKYVALINSDLIPDPESLGKLVEIAESRERTGSIQGTILNRDGTRVMSSGFYLDEALTPYPNIAGSSPTERSISYAEGSFCLINVDAVKKAQGDYLFEDELFAYFEDTLLCLKLWNSGFKVVYAPVVGGRHFGGASSDRGFKRYSFLKNLTALHRIIHSRYGALFCFKGLTLSFVEYALSLSPELSLSSYMKAVSEGIVIGSKLKSKGIKLELCRAPHVRLKARALLMPRRRIEVSIKDVELPHMS